MRHFTKKSAVTELGKNERKMKVKQHGLTTQVRPFQQNKTFCIYITKGYEPEAKVTTVSSYSFVRFERLNSRDEAVECSLDPKATSANYYHRAWPALSCPALS
jgi:hypothetical protein